MIKGEMNNNIMDEITTTIITTGISSVFIIGLMATYVQIMNRLIDKSHDLKQKKQNEKVENYKISKINKDLNDIKTYLILLTRQGFYFFAAVFIFLNISIAFSIVAAIKVILKKKSHVTFSEVSIVFIFIFIAIAFFCLLYSQILHFKTFSNSYKEFFREYLFIYKILSFYIKFLICIIRFPCACFFYLKKCFFDC